MYATQCFHTHVHTYVTYMAHATYVTYLRKREREREKKREREKERKRERKREREEDVHSHFKWAYRAQMRSIEADSRSYELSISRGSPGEVPGPKIDDAPGTLGAL